MKIAPKTLLKMRLAGLSALLLGLTAGCSVTGNPLGTIGQLLGARIDGPARQAGSEYLYYPQYDVYFNQNTNEFISVENGRWVSRDAPRHVSTAQVLRSRAVTMERYDSPAHHRSMMARQDSRYRQQGRDWGLMESPNDYGTDPRYRRY